MAMWYDTNTIWRLPDIDRQAIRYAEWLLNHRGDGPVPVFPLKSRETGTPNVARFVLAREIAPHKGIACGNSAKRGREKLERQCEGYGYPFVEVDPADYEPKSIKAYIQENLL